jgi:hypothetical protein
MADETKGAGKTAPAKTEAPKEEKPKAAKYVVVSEFRDISDFSQIHNTGTDVSYFDRERLKKLVEIGLVKKV